MVLTEAFAAGTPVIASAIAGYSDVVSDGVDGLLVPPGDPQRLAEELQRVHHEPQRLAAMGAAARHSARRYAWPRVADQVTTVYERAMAAPQPVGAGGPHRPLDGPASRRRQPADPAPEACPRSIPRPPPTASAAAASPAASGSASPAMLGALASPMQAMERIGVSQVVESIVRSDLSWVLVAFGLMSISMFFRAASWYWIARAALPGPPGPPPRRHLGDDDRRADVGDPAGPPRGAREGTRPVPPHRAGCGRPSRSCSAPWSRRRCSTWWRWRCSG